MITKIKGVLIFFTLGLMFFVCPSIFAQQGHDSTEKLKVAIPATVDEIFAIVDEQVVALEKAIAVNELNKVHVMAFEIRDLLMALPEKTSALSTQGKSALISSLNKIKQQASLLDKFGDAGDLAQTKTVLKKFKDEIMKINQIEGLKP